MTHETINYNKAESADGTYRMPIGISLHSLTNSANNDVYALITESRTKVAIKIYTTLTGANKSVSEYFYSFVNDNEKNDYHNFQYHISAQAVSDNYVVRKIQLFFKVVNSIYNYFNIIMES